MQLLLSLVFFSTVLLELPSVLAKPANCFCSSCNCCSKSLSIRF